MSWWTKNRKKVGLAAGLLALPFIPGVGASLGGLLGSIFPSAAAGGATAGGVAGGIAGGAAGAAGGGTAQALGSAAASELAKTGTLAALEGGGLGSGASLAGTGLTQGGALGSGSSLVGTGLSQAPTTGLLANAPLPFGTEQAAQFASNVNPQFFNPEITGLQRFGDGALAALKGSAGMASKAAGPMMAANQVMGMAQGQQQPPPPPPQPAPFQPTPVSNPYGMADQPPPGVSAQQWATMSPEMKRRLKGYMA